MSLTDLMSGADLWIYPTIALVIFLAVFVGIVARVLSRRARGEMERAARLPLEDDAVSTMEGGHAHEQQ